MITPPLLSRPLCGIQFLALILGASFSILAAPPSGTIDPTFNPDTPLNIRLSRGNSVLVQPDGKILVAGEFNGVNAVFTPAVVRFNQDGSLDPGFNAVSLPHPASNFPVDFPRLLALQPNGQVLVAGKVIDADGSTRYLPRLNTDGSLDLSFNPRFEFSKPAAAHIYHAVVLADGKVLISGGFTKINGVARGSLARLNADGTLDESFDPAQPPLDFVVQTTGKIVGPVPSNSDDYHLIRLNADGSLDNSFVSTATYTSASVPGLLAQPDDKLIFTTVQESAIPEYPTKIQRLNADGTNDATFQPFSSLGGTALLVENDGKLLIDVIFTQGPARLNADGTPDNSFNPQAWSYAVAQQPDEKLVTVGSIDDQPYGIRRLFLDGSRDDSFAAGLGLTLITSVGIDHAALLPDGRILVAGNFDYIGTVPRTRIALLKTDGKLDPSFDAGSLVGQQSDGSSNLHAIAVQTDGKILLAMDQLVRVTAAGVIDPGFQYTPTKSGSIGSIKIQPDGKILVYGPDGLVRVDANGAVDSSFHAAENGPVAFLQPDGKIMVVGGSRGLTRLFTDGSLDTSFSGVGGAVGFNFPYVSALQSDGKILVSRRDPSNFGDVFVRLNPDGSNDSSFTPNVASVSLLALDQTGIYVGGNIAPQADVSVRQKQTGVLRLKFNGQRDDSFGPVEFDSAARLTELLLQTDRRLLIAGQFDRVNGAERHAIVRITDNGPRKMANISTRANVHTGETVEIAGFIVTGNAPKKVIVRAIGPSLQSYGISAALANPLLELHDAAGHVFARNDNWRDTQESDIVATGLAPANSLESAIVTTLSPGSYTAVVQGADGGEGVALAEVYDLDPASDSALANISTRALVEGNNVMISGLIVLGTETANLVVRALGPSLASANINGPLDDPTLSIYDQSGTVVVANDNWKQTQESELQLRGLNPTDDRESAVLTTLIPGTYTAVVRGANGQNGVALVEVYCLNP